MSDLGPERLYGLLPEILRYRDAEEGQGLRAFLAVFDQEYVAIERSIAALYDDWFVETCEEWLLPYIGDLVGVRSSTLAHALTSRAFVGRSLHYRRRKGTPDALAGAASDATGWPALAVPSYALLAATQSMLDPHPDRGGTVDLRRLVAGAGGQLSRFGGPFDTIQRNVQVCSGAPLSGLLSISLSTDRGRYSLERIGLFFWRLSSFPVVRAAARAVAAGTYTFHPFGIDAPLFNPPRRREGRPHEALLPTPLDAATLDAEAAALVRRNGAEDGFLSPEPAVEIGVSYAGTTGAAQRIPPQAILFCDLSSWSPPPTSVPLPGGTGERAIQVAVDPALGRIAFPAGVEVESLEVSYAYAFSADLGGGPYARPTEEGRRADWRAEVGDVQRQTPATGEADGAGERVWFATLAEALAAWNLMDCGVGRIVIASDELYEPASAATSFSIDLGAQNGAGRRLEIVAASGRRPCLVGDLQARGPALEAHGKEPSAALLLGGLWIDGAVVLSGDLSSLTLDHCTLRPTRRTALEYSGASPTSFEVTLRSSLVGAIRLPSEGCRLDVTDSIVDAAGGATAIGGTLGIAALADPPGPTSRLTRSTIFGKVHLMEISLATDMLFVDPVEVERRSRGLVRRSYLPPGSTTPHRESELPDGTPSPTFTSRVFGQPGYAQLGPNCPHPISRGRYGELGAFHSLRQPARLALLPEIAAEFLPWGLEAEIVFAT
jgi:hypothetical protein